MSLRSYSRALIARSRIVVSLVLIAAAAGAQTSATVPDDAVRVREGSFPIVGPMALQNWTLEVFARRDGWVEIDFAAIPGRRGALPWLFAEGFAGKIGAPVLSRAYFTPEQIRASTRFADSVIDRLMPPDVAAKRFSRGATRTPAIWPDARAERRMRRDPGR